MLDVTELIGFCLAIAMVVCNTRQLQWGWPLAIASSGLYFAVFVQANLYGDAALQILFICLALWGWLQWGRGTQQLGMQQLGSQAYNSFQLKPRSLTKRQAAWAMASWLCLWLLISGILYRFTDSDVVLADAFITSASIAATLLLARKFTANWLVWLAVNVVSVILFIYKALWLTAALYALLAVMSVHGWRVWRRDV